MKFTASLENMEPLADLKPLSNIGLGEKMKREEEAEKLRQTDYEDRFQKGLLTEVEKKDLNPEVLHTYQDLLIDRYEFHKRMKEGNLSNEDVAKLTLEELGEYADIREKQGKKVFNPDDEKIRTLSSRFKRILYKVAIGLGFMAVTTNTMAKEFKEADRLKPDLKTTELRTNDSETGQDSGKTYVLKGEDLEGGLVPDIEHFVSQFEQSLKDNPDDYNLSAADLAGLNSIQKARLIAEKNPGYLLQNVPDLKNVPEFEYDLPYMISDALKLSSDSLFPNVPNLHDIPGLDLAALINEYKLKEPASFLCNTQYLTDIPDVDLPASITEIGKVAPIALLQNIQNVPDIPGVDKAALIHDTGKNSPYQLFRTPPDLTGIAIDKYNFYLEIGSESPRDFFAMASRFVFNKNVADLDMRSLVKAIIDKAPSAYVAAEPTMSLKKIFTEEETKSLVNQAFDASYKIVLDKDNPDKAAVEQDLRLFGLKTVNALNKLHEKPAAERFTSVEDFSSRQLYTVMTYGEEEIYTSSFNGCFDRLMVKMAAEKIDGQQLFDQVGSNGFRSFIKECTWFNRLDDFLGKMDRTQADELLKNVVKNIEASGNKLDQALTLAEIFGYVTDPGTLKILQEQVKAEFERLDGNPSADQADKAMYGILASMFSDDAVVDQEWFKDIKNEYHMDKVTGLKSSELFDANGVCAQKYYFYESGDGDGKKSFKNFMSRYEDDAKWTIDRSHEGFVVISAENGGRKIEIYANDPGASTKDGQTGAEAMDQVLKENGAEIKVYSYRGHSFGVSLGGVSKETRIINLGSCGGFKQISNILNLSPDSHDITTKGTGSMYVNDPLFKDLNEKILRGEDIDWKTFWEEEARKLGGNENFENYVAPNENLGMMFMKAFNQKISDQQMPQAFSAN